MSLYVLIPLIAATLSSSLLFANDDRKEQAVSQIFERIQYYMPLKGPRSVGRCADRAVFLSMELAIEGIPSRALTLAACAKTFKDKEQLFLSDTGGNWIYHTAPIIQWRDGVAVIDPYFAPQYPMTVQKWMALTNSTDKKFYVLINSANLPGDNIQKPELCGQGQGQQIDLTAIAMPIFRREDVLRTCAHLYDDIKRWSALGRKGQKQMASSLFSRADFLWKKLKDLNLTDQTGLDGYSIASQCKTYKEPTLSKPGERL